MKNDHKKIEDSTESWLYRLLDGYSPEAPANAWQRLVPQLPRRKKRRPLLFWVAGAATGVAAALALFWLLNHDTLPATVENRMVGTVLLPDNPEKKGGLITPEIIHPTAGANVRSQNRHNTQPPSVFFSHPITVGSNPGHNPASQPAGAVTMKNETAGFVQQSTRLYDFRSLETRPVKPLALRHLAEKIQPEYPWPTAPVLPKKTKFPRFWWGVEASPLLFIQKNMGRMPGGLSFNERYAHPGLGWQAGLLFAAEPVKNWRVAIGIQRLQQMHEATHSATLRLMDGVCLNPYDPGLKEYEFRYAVVSGGEQNDLTLRLQQQEIGSSMPHDEPFTLSMKTIHRSAAWRIPLTIERRWGTGAWRGFVRGGAVLDFAEKTGIEVIHFTEFCEDLCFQGGHMPSIQVVSASHLSPGWMIGAGIERQISPRAALRLEPFITGKKSMTEFGLRFGLLVSN